MKKVSIIVPLFKSEAFLHKLIQSIIGQTYSNFELILVDDGSPDKSGIIADEYAASDQRLRVIHKENGGTCSARNSGLEIASGDYLMFADGDDWLELDCVEYLVDLLEQNNADMSMTDSIFTTRDRKQNSHDNIRVWSNKEAVAGIINTFIIPVGPWNKLYKTELIRRHNIYFSVPWFGEGLYFSTMSAMYSRSIAVGHRRVYNYRLNNPNSGCTVKDVKNMINSLGNILYIKEHLTISSEAITEALNWHIWTNNFNLIDAIIASGERLHYEKEYQSTKSEMRRLMPVVMKHKLLPFSRKVKTFLATFFPEAASRYLRYTKAKAFKKDTME
ncbi:MAG: glycosyltransferase [Synergistaceae bacterium]|nr:glycosyltransferase [Synergistaceae bacterium]MBR0035529.1 glycosyltransferase [Synergistaceae bacterium]